MPVILSLLLSAPLASATPVQFTHQGRLLDAAGAPLNGTFAVDVSLCPNAATTSGEVCHTETFAGVSVADGYFAVQLGQSGALDHTFFDVPALWIGVSVGGASLGPREPIASFVPHTGMLHLGGPSAPCTGGQHEGAVVYDAGDLKFCTASGWRTVSTAIPLINTGGVRTWGDGSFAASCNGYLNPGPGSRLYAGATGSGAYRIDVDGTGSTPPFDVYCDMVTDGGGWTLLLNLDTSDGHVMWWGSPLWTDTAAYGTVDDNPFDGDLKGQGYMDFTGASEVLLAVHEQGVQRGWKRFAAANGNSLYWWMTSGGENATLGTSVLASSVSGLWANERLVRTSTTLMTNRCITSGGSCLSNNGGSPDGDRISSPQATVSDNTGGGLGNWHDMNYCCSGTVAGHTCNGSAYRTCSEAQAGWGSVYGDVGTFGSDSCAPMTNTGSNAGCGNANWALANGVAYDYAVFVR